MKATKKSGKNATKTTKIAYPKTNVSVLEQTNNAPQTVQSSSFGTDLFEENNRIKQQIDEIKTNQISSQPSSSSESIDLTPLENAISQNANDIDALQSSVNSNTSAISNLQNAKQDTLTAGSNISITNGVISATDTTYTAGQNITIQNGVISSTASGGSQDLSQLESQVEQNAADLQTLKSYVIEPDYNYTGRTPADYQEGTIFQTYDCIDENFELSNSASISLPKIYFCAEIGAIGTIKIEEKFCIQTTLANVLITTTLNGTQICQDVFEVSALDTEQTYQKTFYDLQLNDTDKSNNIVITITLQTVSGTKTLICKNQKIEVIAPNADILSKVCPFDAVEIAGKYYLTNCFNGTLKTYNTTPNLMYNTNAINWVDTGIETNYAKTICNLTQYNSTYTINEIGYLYKKYQNNKINLIMPNSNVSKEFTHNMSNFDWREFYDARISFLLTIYNEKIVQNIFYNVSTDSVGSNSFGNIAPAKVVGHRHLLSFPNNFANAIPLIIIAQNGDAWLMKTSATSTAKLNLGHCSDATLYVKDIVNINNFKVECFLKRYDKIIQQEYHVTSSAITLLSEQEMGSYDKIFLMPNNDYFAVKNNKISYHLLGD